MKRRHRAIGSPTKAEQANQDAQRAKPKASQFNWSRVKQGRPDECWPWTGGVNSWGYGSVQVDGIQMNASRAAYIAFFGRPAEGLVVCHRCDNPICCNPMHLFAATQAENLEDCRNKGRARGHFAGGAEHPNHVAKLNPDSVREIRGLSARGLNNCQIARRYGVDNTTIRSVVLRKSWRHVA